MFPVEYCGTESSSTFTIAFSWCNMSSAGERETLSSHFTCLNSKYTKVAVCAPSPPLLFYFQLGTY